MAFRIKINKDNDKKGASYLKHAGEIRKSQVVSTYGPGALVDFPRISGIIAGIDDWEKTLGQKTFQDSVLHERNLERILGKKYFIQIKDNKLNREAIKGIDVYRFPEYVYCPECGRLDKYYRLRKKTTNNTEYNSEIYCAFCAETKKRNVKLIPSRFVMACECGHIEEFPFEWWVHRESGRCENPKLTISFSSETSGLDGISIKCKCGAHATMKGVMDKGTMHQRKCHGSMPWLGKTEDMKSWYMEYQYPECCDAELMVLQRGSNNVYYPQVVQALTIPPYSSRIQKILMKDIDLLESYMKMPEKLREGNLEYYYESHQAMLKCNRKQFNEELKYAVGDEDVIYSDLQQLIKGEYRALCDDDCNDIDFLTIGMDVPDYFKNYLGEIKIVGRLREVQVLQGFKRIKPNGTMRDGSAIPIMQISKENKAWLPAVELFGEGIFIRFDEEKICEWEQKNTKRYQVLMKNVKNSFLAQNKVSDGCLRYILLHTFSHILIRELSEKCGYTSASLKEKIYSSSGVEGMCGVLIYTASNDSDGSLGGLARQGETTCIENLILSALETASWCSNDPLCIDSKNQGLDKLNYAACHACTLLPETSCECSNVLLDRGSLIGTSDDVSFGFFGELL